MGAVAHGAADEAVVDSRLQQVVAAVTNSDERDALEVRWAMARDPIELEQLHGSLKKLEATIDASLWSRLRKEEQQAGSSARAAELRAEELAKSAASFHDRASAARASVHNSTQGLVALVEQRVQAVGSAAELQLLHRRQQRWQHLLSEQERTGAIQVAAKPELPATLGLM